MKDVTYPRSSLQRRPSYINCYRFKLNGKYTQGITLNQSGMTQCRRFSKPGTDIFSIIGFFYRDCIHSTFYNLTVQLCCPLQHCLMLYSDSLYSQHILQPHCTAVLLTTTLSDAVLWQFVFTAHSTTSLYSCPTHYYTVWCCTVTVCIHSTFYNLTVQLSYSLLHCLMLYCDSLYSQHILQPYCAAVLLPMLLPDALQWQLPKRR